MAGTARRGSESDDWAWNWWDLGEETLSEDQESEVELVEWFQSHLEEWFGTPMENQITVRIICLECGGGFPGGCTCE